MKTPLHNISICTINIRSIRNKLDALLLFISIHQPDFLCVSESWLNKNIHDNEITIDGYSFLRKDRHFSLGGGVLLYYKEYFNLSPLLFSSNLEIVGASFTLNNYSKPFLICAIYMPPNSALNHFEELYDLLFPFKQSHNLFLAGDFNLPEINWLNPNSTYHLNRTSTFFIDLLFNFNLEQRVFSPTRSTPSVSNVLDLIITPPIFDISSNYILPGLSDHDIPFIELSLQTQPSHSATTSYYNFNKVNFDQLRKTLSDALPAFTELSNTQDINLLWNHFKEILHNILYTVPKKTITKRNQYSKPWLNRDIIHLKRKCRKFSQKLKRDPSNLHISQEYRHHFQRLKATENLAKNKYLQIDLPNYITSKPDKFWNYLRPKKKTFNLHLQINNVNFHDLSEIVNQFNMAFHSVFQSDSSNIPIIPNSPSILSTLAPIHFSKQGIVKLLQSLKKSSTGPDNIPNILLKNCPHEIASFLLLIFNVSLNTASIPQDWKTNKIIPIHKSGNCTHPLNYRPISLTSSCCKIMEHIIAKEIRIHLEFINFFSPTQHGFRPGFSTTTQLSLFSHDLSSVLDSRSQVDVVFLDFSKAFDKVPHSKLIYKLSKLDLNPQIVNWIRSYLSNRSQYVEIHNVKSSSLNVLSGTPQGSVISPLLFLIYINDLVQNLTVSHRLFADDCVVYHEIKSIEDNIILQNNLNLIFDWCRTWSLPLNIAKTALLQIHRKSNPLSFNYNINSVPVHSVSNYKYLGLTFTNDLNWNLHISNICNSALTKLFYLRRQLKHSTKNIRLLCYKTYILPILQYGCEIWDPYTELNIMKIEAIQNKATRFIMNNWSRNSSISLMKQELGLFPLSENRKILRLTLLFKFFFNLIGPPTPPFITPASYISSRIDHLFKLAPISFRTNSHKYSLFPRSIQDWNRLPHDVVSSPDVETFKKLSYQYFCSAHPT